MPKVGNLAIPKPIGNRASVKTLILIYWAHAGPAFVAHLYLYNQLASKSFFRPDEGIEDNAIRRLVETKFAMCICLRACVFLFSIMTRRR